MSRDLRAAIAPFLANNTIGLDSYKWLLYGDDDTVFFIDNVIKVLGDLDYAQPYFLSDALWWPETGNVSSLRLHPNRDAPRCLPCNFADPLLANGSCAPQQGFIAPQGCPCTPETIFSSTWSSGDQGAFDRAAKQWTAGPDNPQAGWWYMVHGGAGAIISQGAMRLASFQEVERYLQALPWHSGDAMLTETMWHVLGLATTDPGYGYCRPHIQMFDPGWLGQQQLLSEDVSKM
ncbi:hypothetical protein WJX73_002692 [Symbiochloris irregularis]|uniref:Hexosyltransferase n=1 Tax=Symbiochloris irregularis TaxID=706552 RepID=A0AAW1NM64_9CHLO